MNIGEAIGSPLEFAEESSIPELVTPNHNVGVEIEIENVTYLFESDSPVYIRSNRFTDYPSDTTISIPNKHWLIVKDNSLRQGVEFIFNGPQKGQNIVNALEEMKGFFQTYTRKNSPPVASDRTSVHVHLDVRDLPDYKLQRLLMLYALFERVLFTYVDDSRFKNNYCRPLNDSMFKNIAHDIAASSQFNDVIHLIKHYCDKYSALNLLPLTTFGSVEFRHHEGTTDMEKIRGWINIILCLKMATAIDPKELEYDYYSKGYKEVIKRVFRGSPLATDYFLNDLNVEDAMRKGYNDFIELLNFDNLANLNGRDNFKLTKIKLNEVFVKANFGKDIPIKKTPKKRSKPVPPPQNETWVQVTELFESGFNIAAQTPVQEVFSNLTEANPSWINDMDDDFEENNEEENY